MINTTYSLKDFTGQTFLEVDPDEFSNTEIVGSCFAQEAPYSEDASHNGSSNHRDTRQDVFPNGMHSVTFTRCNLDNCKVPGPPTIKVGGTHRKIRIMNDLEDWELGADNKPTAPMATRRYHEQGHSIDPADISATKLAKRITDRTG